MTAEPVIVSDATFRRDFNARHALALRARVVGSDARTVARVTRTVVGHDRTRALGRQVVYVPAGVRAVALWLWENCTGAGLAQDVKEARARGDFENMMKLRELQAEERHRRFERIMGYILAPQKVLKGLVIVVLMLFGGLLALGIAAALMLDDKSLVTGPIRAVFWAGAWLVWAFTVGGTALVAGGCALVVLCLWWAGKKAGDVPQFLAPPITAAQREVDEREITDTGVATALAHVNIPALNKAIKDGWKVEFLLPPTLVNGRGYQMVHSIPLGVTAAMIADRRDVYARNLSRAPLEVWPTAYERRSGFVETWVAHPGATERAGSPYPLLHEGTVDVFKGVPMGESQRGDLIAPPLMEASMCVGGLPGQGKSNAVRVIMAGAALDPLADLRVYVFAGNGDFDAFEPRLSRYRRGVDDSVVQDAVNELRELYREVERREQRLAELGAKKLSRSIASKHPDMRPIIAGFSEVHELFGHPDLGKEAGDLAIAVTKRQRKTGIFTVYDTQSSRAAAIPSALVELFKFNACFAVKTWRSNDGFLGDGSFQAGIRATELRPTKDRGTSLVTGITDESFELLDWFYLEADDDTGYDAATDIIARAVKAMKPGVNASQGEDERDLLDDVYELMGDEERCRASEMAVMLRRVDPSYRPYVNLDGVQLAAMLSELGVPVRPHKGYPKFTAAAVLAARDGRG